MMPLEQLSPILRARWRSLAFTWLAVVGVVLAVSLALPPRYEATAALAVEQSGMDPLASGPAAFKPAGAVSTYIATQLDVLKSEEVALGAVRRLGLEHLPKWRERWQRATGGRGSFDSWLASQLLASLDVRPSRDSNVLRLGFTSTDPRFSSAAANAFVQSYMDTTLQMRVGPARQFSSFFAERAKPLREALEQAKARLTAYEKEHGVMVGEGADPESARLAEMTSQLVKLQDEVAEAANRRRAAQASPAQSREVLGDPEVAALTAQLVAEQAKLAQLRSDLGERNPAVMQARQSIRDVRRRIADAERRAAASLAAPVKVAQARLAELKAAIARQEQVVMQRKSERDAATALVRDVANAQKAYDAVLQHASQSALEGASTTQTNISVLKSATVPFAPTPLVLVNTLVAVLLGLLLGVARALIAEARDRRLRSAADVTLRLKQPLLLGLPDGRAPLARRSEHTRRRLVAPQPRLAAPNWISRS
jgi:chain length determinant protein EpsF